MAKILVVDDMPAVRRSMCMVLKGAGYEAFEAENGHMCLDMIGDQDYDLIITDMLMPEMDGFELVEKLQGVANRPSIIAMSGGGANIASSRALDSVSAFVEKTLPKPFHKGTLIDAVHQLTNKEG